ncbi:MAG TPA: hypothetical protein ENN39_00715 [Desulfonatronum sp.]|nr:hypothetical protein [Desulfonatronum sp.]
MSTKEAQKALVERIEDEIGSESRQLYQKFMEQWRLIAVFAAAIVVFAAVYAGYGAYQDHRLIKAEQALERAIFENQGAQRLAALAELQGALPASLLPRYRLETAKAAHELQDWSQVLESWARLAQEGPDNWSVLGRLGKSTTMLRLGQVREALEELERLRGQAPESMHSVILLQLAEAAELAGAWEKALAVYEELKTRGDPSQAGFLDFKATQAQEQLGTNRS